jgi:hypothetical protein
VVAVTALITRALPEIIHTRAIARTVKQACDKPQAERALRVLMGPEYPDRRAQTTGVLLQMLGAPPDMTSGRTASAEAVPDSTQDDKALEAPAAIRKLAA